MWQKPKVRACVTVVDRDRGTELWLGTSSYLVFDEYLHHFLTNQLVATRPKRRLPISCRLTFWASWPLSKKTLSHKANVSPRKNTCCLGTAQHPAEYTNRPNIGALADNKRCSMNELSSLNGAKAGRGPCGRGLKNGAKRRSTPPLEQEIVYICYNISICHRV